MATDEDGNVLQGPEIASLEGSDVYRLSIDHARGDVSVCCTICCSRGAAVSVPITFKYSGTFVAGGQSSCGEGEVLVTDTVTGTGSHLGLFTATYPLCVDFVANEFSGTATFTAANGDQLSVALGGSAENPSCTTDCAVTFTGSITGGTGRFEGVGRTLTGTGTVNIEPTLTGTVEAALTGTINKEPMPF
jgi:hypothetical protein